MERALLDFSPTTGTVHTGVGAAPFSAVDGVPSSATALERGRSFVRDVLAACRGDAPGEEVATDGFDVFPLAPRSFEIFFEPAPSATPPRVLSYKVPVGEAVAIDGVEDNSVTFLFSSPVVDPFVPQGAMALRLIVSPSGLSNEAELQFEWVNALKGPLVVHKDVPCNRLRIVVVAPKKAGDDIVDGPVMQTIASTV